MTAEDGKKSYKGERGRECDYCKISPAILFCHPDSAFLCSKCDSSVHEANKLASRHDRVQMCDVCENAPAAFTCKADSASLCVTCDSEVHSANPLARRHDRVPVVPFSKPSQIMNDVHGDEDHENGYDESDGRNVKEEEKRMNDFYYYEMKPATEGGYFFSDVDSYLDLDYAASMDQNCHPHQHHHMTADSVVPGIAVGVAASFQPPPSFFSTVSDYSYSPYSTAASFTHSVSSSEVGVVPNSGSTTTEISAAVGLDRKARVLRYREKRKNRRFEKTIRYASRKAYAEIRPRIKGRFAKQTMIIGMDVDDENNNAIDSGYGVVPSF